MEYVSCDVLVIGGGAAGLRAAYEAQKIAPSLKVVMAISGDPEASGSSNIAASEALGINAPFDFAADGDSPDAYYADMLETGEGLGNPAMYRILANESKDRIAELSELGVNFERSGEVYRQQKLSGCTKARSLTCGGSTGRQITKALSEAAIKAGVILLGQTAITQLCRDNNGRVCGAAGISCGKETVFKAKSVVLATGGASAAFSVNVTPLSQEGDGWAMAYEAGCSFVNMEFFQIGPAVARPGFKFIIHSHMWRLKPKLTNAAGEEFLERYCGAVPASDALDLKAMSYPFSIRTAAMYVDIGIFKEVLEGRGTAYGGILMDVSHIPKDELLKKAPITYNTLSSAGIDIAKEPLDLRMAVQNFNGGIQIDENGYTGVEGLYAAGEVTGGVHGSDRPGGNNLTDTQVFGYRAGRSAAQAACNFLSTTSPDYSVHKLQATTEGDTQAIKESEKLYYKYLTVIRSKAGLEEVLNFADMHEKNAGAKLHNRLLVGKLIATAALAREESRGTHYREDFPGTDEGFNRRGCLKKGADGVIAHAWQDIIQ